MSVGQCTHTKDVLPAQVSKPDPGTRTQWSSARRVLQQVAQGAATQRQPQKVLPGFTPQSPAPTSSAQDTAPQDRSVSIGEAAAAALHAADSASGFNTGSIAPESDGPAPDAAFPVDFGTLMQPAAAPLETDGAPAPAAESDADLETEALQPQYTDSDAESNGSGKIAVVAALSVAAVVVVGMIVVFLYHRRAQKPLPGGAVDSERAACTACAHAVAEGACLACCSVCCFCCAVN